MATSIDLKRPVVVKVVMTDSFRAEMLTEARQSIQSIDKNLVAQDADVGKQIRNLEVSNPQQASILTEQWEAEKARQMKMREELDWRIKELQSVDLGAEVPFRVFDGSVTLSVGDDFMARMSRAEILLKDWKVIEIRD